MDESKIEVKQEKHYISGNQKCGEIYIDTNNVISINCFLCTLNFDLYEPFSNHLRIIHLSVNDVDNTSSDEKMQYSSTKFYDNMVSENAFECKQNNTHSIKSETSNKRNIRDSFNAKKNSNPNDVKNCSENNERDVSPSKVDIQNQSSNKRGLGRCLTKKLSINAKRIFVQNDEKNCSENTKRETSQNKVRVKNKTRSKSRVEGNLTKELSVNVKRIFIQNKRGEKLSRTKADIKNIKSRIKVKKKSREKLYEKAPEGFWRCLFCGDAVEIVMKDDHMKKHKKFICETCGKGFDRKTRLVVHVLGHSDQRPFKCRYCSKTFKSDQNVKTHEKTHLNLKYQCKICNATLASKNTLSTHTKNHSLTEPIHKCDLCPKSFLTKRKMLGHRGRHKFEGKQFQCTQCPKSFATKYNLDAHTRLTHKGEYNYKCEFCEKVFIKLSMKKSHEFSHTRVGNPFSCDICEKGYATKQGVYNHKKRFHKEIQSLITKYHCDKCDETFSHSLELYVEHCRKHNIEENKFACKYCPDRFDSDKKLKMHSRVAHNL